MTNPKNSDNINNRETLEERTALPPEPLTILFSIVNLPYVHPNHLISPHRSSRQCLVQREDREALCAFLDHLQREWRSTRVAVALQMGCPPDAVVLALARHFRHHGGAHLSAGDLVADVFAAVDAGRAGAAPAGVADALASLPGQPERLAAASHCAFPQVSGVAAREVAVASWLRRQPPPGPGQLVESRLRAEVTSAQFQVASELEYRDEDIVAAMGERLVACGAVFESAGALVDALWEKEEEEKERRRSGVASSGEVSRAGRRKTVAGKPLHPDVWTADRVRH